MLFLAIGLLLYLVLLRKYKTMNKIKIYLIGAETSKTTLTPPETIQMQKKKDEVAKAKAWAAEKNEPFTKPIFSKPATTGMKLVGMDSEIKENAQTWKAKGLAANLIDHYLSCKENSSSSTEMNAYDLAIGNVRQAVAIAHEKLIQ